jgi:MFS superfamily sulfate permease-like transporter
LVNVREVKVGRGALLTVMLVVLGLAQLLGVVSGFVQWRKIVEHSQAYPEIPLLGALLGLVGLAALVGVWLWQRRAVYLLAGTVAIGILTDVWFGLPSYMLLIRLVLLGVLALAIRQRWQSFR